MSHAKDLRVTKLHADIGVGEVHQRAKKLYLEGQSKHEYRPILFLECGAKHGCPTHIEEDVDKSNMGECSSENPEVLLFIDDLVIVQ